MIDPALRACVTADGELEQNTLCMGGTMQQPSGLWRRRVRGVLSYSAGFLLGILVGMSATHAFG